jgi:LEA14-like dessication related protein
MPRPALLLPLVVVCLASVGCSNLSGLQRPTASVTGMELGEVDARGFTMNLGVDVANPNGVVLPLAGADYELGVGGVRALGGRAKPQGSVPANGSRQVTVPVSVAFDDLLAAEQAIRDSGGDVPYDLQGGLTFQTGNPLLGSPRVPLRYSGMLPLRRVLSDPEALLHSEAARRLAREVLGRFFGR